MNISRKVAAGGSLAALLAALGMGTAYAATQPSAPAPSPAGTSQQADTADKAGAAEPAEKPDPNEPAEKAGPDTDNLQEGPGPQDGPQTGPEDKGSGATEKGEKAGPDTDTVQSGDQSGPDTTG